MDLKNQISNKFFCIYHGKYQQAQLFWTARILMNEIKIGQKFDYELFAVGRPSI